MKFTQAEPTIVEIEQLKREASKRRTALVQAGCSTYSLGLKGGSTAIVCLCCGLGSPNPSDIAQKYCGFCHEFHNEWAEDSK